MFRLAMKYVNELVNKDEWVKTNREDSMMSARKNIGSFQKHLKQLSSRAGETERPQLQ